MKTALDALVVEPQQSRGLTVPALLMPSEFPRIYFSGNSPACIKRGARRPWLLQ
jgi:hypothetical protein